MVEGFADQRKEGVVMGFLRIPLIWLFFIFDFTKLGLVY